METGASKKPHSWEFFGPERDHWWNRDYLALIASRLELEGLRSVLDVGCGIGHWGRLLGSVLHAEASFVGLDREPRWLSRAAQLADQQELGDRFRYEQGTAQELPLRAQRAISSSSVRMMLRRLQVPVSSSSSASSSMRR